MQYCLFHILIPIAIWQWLREWNIEQMSHIESILNFLEFSVWCFKIFSYSLCPNCHAVRLEFSGLHSFIQVCAFIFLDVKVGSTHLFRSAHSKMYTCMELKIIPFTLILCRPGYSQCTIVQVFTQTVVSWFFPSTRQLMHKDYLHTWDSVL